MVAIIDHRQEELERIERYRKNLHQLVDLACSADAQKLCGNKQAEPDARCADLLNAIMEYNARVLGIPTGVLMILLGNIYRDGARSAIEDILKGGERSE
jgi:hypothetical protein